jgi:hypothetical protein
MLGGLLLCITPAPLNAAQLGARCWVCQGAAGLRWLLVMSLSPPGPLCCSERPDSLWSSPDAWGPLRPLTQQWLHAGKPATRSRVRPHVPMGRCLELPRGWSGSWAASAGSGRGQNSRVKFSRCAHTGRAGALRAECRQAVPPAR